MSLPASSFGLCGSGEGGRADQINDSELSIVVAGQKQISDDIARMADEQRAVARAVGSVQADVAELLAAIRNGAGVPGRQPAELSHESSPWLERAVSPGDAVSVRTDSAGLLYAQVAGERVSVKDSVSMPSAMSVCEHGSMRSDSGEAESEHLRMMYRQARAPRSNTPTPGDSRAIVNHSHSTFMDENWPTGIALRSGIDHLNHSKASPNRLTSSERLSKVITGERLSEKSRERLTQDVAGGSEGQLTNDSTLVSEKLNKLMPSETAGVLRCCMVYPNSPKRKVIDGLCVVVLLFDLIVIPYMLAWDMPFVGFLQVMAWSSCILWTLDIILKLLTGVFVNGVLRMELRVAARAAVSVTFIFDLTVTVSDWVSMLVITFAEDESSDGLRIVRLAKAGRLLKIIKMLRLMNFFSATVDYIDNQLSETYKMMLNITVLSFGALLANHWICCFWIMVGRSGPTDTGFRWVNMEWAMDGRSLEYLQADRVYQYVAAFHWSVVQLTGGNIEIECTNTMERIFNIICLIMGLTFGSTFVSSLSAMMIDYQMMKKDKTQKMRKLRQFLLQNAVDRHVGVRVQQQAEERLAKREHWREEDVPALDLLSANLRAELRVNIFQRYLETHPLFCLWGHLDGAAVRRLCDEAVTFTFLRRKDDLFVAGAKASSAYFLASGTLHYMQDPDGSEGVGELLTKTVAEGVWMCESALWTEWVHVGRAEATTHAKVISISASGLLDTLKRQRRVREVTLQYAKQFHARVATASPPAPALPTDLEVPFTGWDDIVVSLDRASQVQIGLVALEQLGRQAGFFSLFRNDPHRLDKLRSEVVTGKSCLLTTVDGEVQRVCSVAVLRAERVTEEGTEVLAQLGTFEDGEAKLSCQLPGGKQEAGEQTSETVQRLLSEKLQAFNGRVEVQSMDREVHQEFSKATGIQTKYLRTICTCAVVKEIEAKTLFAAMPQMRRTTWYKGDKVRERTVSKGSAGSIDSVVRRSSSMFCVDKEVLVMSGQDTRHLVMVWLSPDEFERISAAAKANKIYSDRLSTWLQSLQQHLPATPDPPAQQRRSTARSTTGRLQQPSLLMNL